MYGPQDALLVGVDEVKSNRRACARRYGACTIEDVHVITEEGNEVFTECPVLLYE